MAIYKFRISNPSGQISEILVEGESQAEATRRLQRRGEVPLEFLGEGSLVAAGSKTLGIFSRFDVIDFTDRLVPLLQAHIPLERALGILQESSEDEFAARVIADLRKGLQEGRKFSQLIRDRGRLFPNIYASVIEAGEEAGALPQVMADLRSFLTESRELRSYIISASIYPCAVLVVSLAVAGVLLGVIVPKFAEVIQGAGGSIPLSTRALLALSGFVRRDWWFFPLLLAGIVFLLYRARREGWFRVWLDRWALSLPLIRHLTLYSNLSRMARTMAILMRSGVHLLDTVAIAAKVLQNTQIRQSISGLASELRQGQRLSAALGGSRFIPAFMLSMLAVGEETGSVDIMLERVAERYEGDLRRTVRRTLSLFEPITILILGLFVGTIVVTMFLAILDTQSGL